MAANPNCLIIVGPCRLSWLNVFKPREKVQGNTVKRWYEATLMFPKDPKHPYFVDGQYEKIIAAIREAIADMFGPKEVDKYMNAPDNVFKMCLKDGDVVTADDGNGNWVPKYPGYWFMNVTAKEDKPPRLMNAHDKSTATAADGWVSGDWGQAQLNFYAFNNESKGVAAGLRALQFCYKDEPFGGAGAATATADDFGDVPNAHAPVRNGGGDYGGQQAYRSVLDDIVDALENMPDEVLDQWKTWMAKTFNGNMKPSTMTGQQQDKLWRAIQGN